MRIIPKKSKVNATVWRSFTIFDILLAFVLFGIGVLIAMSNFEYKWAILLGYASIAVMLFFGEGDERAYNDLVYMFKYTVSRKKYEKGRKRGDVQELIPFNTINDDGVVEYDGYFGAVVEVGSVEFGLLDEVEQNRRISVFADMLNGLGANSVVQLVKIDRPINYDVVSEELFEKLEAAQKAVPTDPAKIAVLESRLNQIDGINNIEKQYRPYYYLALYDTERDALLRQVDYVRAKLDVAALPSKMLEAKEVAVFFKYCYTRNFDERTIDDVVDGNYADFVKPNKIKFTATGAICDDVHSFTCAISDYPLVVGNAWGAEIFNIDNTKVVLTIKPIDRDKAVKRIDRAVVELQTRHGSGKLSEAISQETHVQTMAELAQRLQNENELLFDCTLTITGFNNTAETNAAFKKAIRRQIQSGGFKVNLLRGRQFDGFATASISRKTALRSLERGINSESLAAVFPFVFTSIIEPKGFTLGYEYYPVILDIWKRDLKQHINSNIMVLGKSGSGKSFFGKTLISLVYSDESKIFILDPENEYLNLCRNVNGRFIDVGNATEGRLNPLHIYQILTDDGTPAPPEAVFSSHLRFLESFFAITLKGITSDALEELNNLIAKLYERKGITSETDCTELKPEDYPTFDDLKQLVEDEFKAEHSPMRHQNLDRIRTYVAKFASGGRFANLWNGPSTLTTDERLVVFNFQSLFAAKNNIVANAQMLVIMRYLDQQIINIRELNRNREKPLHPFVVLDEGYNFVDTEYPIALEFVVLWYKRIRKYDGSIAFLTQNLSDILGNQQVVQKTTAIINNTQYSFIFSLAPADLAILTDLYKNAGEINEVEQNQIANAGNGECFAICSIKERTSFRVVASDVVYTLFDVADGMQLIEAGTPRTPNGR